MNDNQISFIQEHMVRYFERRGRKYPWRINRTPYKVYLSEMLLQRTRADQVEPVFIELIERFPDSKSLYAGFDHAER